MARFFPVLALYCAHLRVRADTTISWINVTVSLGDENDCVREEFYVQSENTDVNFVERLKTSNEFQLIPVGMKLRVKEKSQSTDMQSGNSAKFWSRCCPSGEQSKPVNGCYSIQTSSVTISRNCAVSLHNERWIFKVTSDGDDGCSPCKPASAETVSKPASAETVSTTKTKTSARNSVKGGKAKGKSKTPKPANVTEEEESVHPGLFGKLKKPENLVACGLIILTFLYASVGWIVNYLL